MSNRRRLDCHGESGRSYALEMRLRSAGPLSFAAASAPGPLLGEDRPALVVAPAPVDLQVARREALEPEARPLGQRDRRLVVGLDVRLDPVQPECSESVLEHELDPLAHVAKPGIRRPDGVTEIRVQERPAEDLAEVEEAEDPAVAAPAEQEELEVVGARAVHERGELLLAHRRERPRLVQRAALAHQRGELAGVAAAPAAHERPLPSLERAALRSPAKSNGHAHMLLDRGGYHVSTKLRPVPGGTPGAAAASVEAISPRVSAGSITSSSSNRVAALMAFAFCSASSVSSRTRCLRCASSSIASSSRR